MKTIIGILLMLGITLQAGAQDPQLISYTFRVEGVCGMCKDRIETTAVDNGAVAADWNMDTKMLTVTIDEEKYNISDLRHALAMAGHDNGTFITPDDVYEDLHACCKYRDMDADETHGEAADIQEDHFDGKSREEIDAMVIDGYVYGIDDKGKRFALIGANVVIADDPSEGTTTNFDGYFMLENEEGHDRIIVSYIGYETDTITLQQDDVLEIYLSDGHKLDEVVIEYKKRTTEISFVKTMNIQKITREELTKAACCNLSESFETNPSVDVSFTDAVTGARQIQMLGLAGPYVQITRELIPDVRAMSSIYGLTYTPGPWVESIQLIKGTGSVVNGFESISGQINVELKKPQEGEDLHLNGYMNEGGRMELNLNTRKELSDKWSTAILLHGKRMAQAHDRNNDGFVDMPLENDLIFINRWKWRNEAGWEGQFGIKGTYLDHEGGSHEHFEEGANNHEDHWRMDMQTRRAEFWLKTGIVFPDNPSRSVGFQFNSVYHDQDSEFGYSPYNNEQKSLYANLIFQEILPDPVHTIRLGLSYQYDDIDEFVAKNGTGIFTRNESVAGMFAEYSYDNIEKFAVIPGIRVDHHNNYGLFVTPRLHAKYNFSERSLVRLTAGRGLRTASIFSENLGLFSTNRVIRLESNDTDNPYGLDPEVAWNYGINLTQAIPVANDDMVLSVDFYRTSFENQIIADFENPREIAFYNLDGKSYSNSFQVQLDYQLFPGMDARIAYRLFDVKMEYRDGLRTKPLIPRHRAFLNLMYETDSGWAFDVTTNWRGSQRIPSTEANPEAFRQPDASPDYFLVNTQVSKSWGEAFQIYLGGENVLDYQQSNAIVAAEDPFGQYFDGSLVWAPLFGRNIYVGFRYNLNR